MRTFQKAAECNGSSLDSGRLMRNFVSSLSVTLTYIETTRTTEIQLSLLIHRFVCCDKISSITVKS